MNKNIVKNILLPVFFIFTGIFVAQAQSAGYFLDKKEVDGKLISVTKYDLINNKKDLYKPVLAKVYTYDEQGNRVMEEFFRWDNDNSKIPVYRIFLKYNDNKEMIESEICWWNEKEASYDNITDKIKYNSIDPGNTDFFTYSYIKSDNK